MWIGGEIVPLEEARVPVLDRGFLWGDAVFETLRTWSGALDTLGEHLDRLGRSAALVAIALPARRTIERAVRATVRALDAAEAQVRVVVTRGDGGRGIAPRDDDRARLVVIARPLARTDASAVSASLSVVTVPQRRDVGGADPRAKTASYLPSVLAVAEARRRGADEALVGDGAGRVLEGATSSLFVVRGGRIATAPLAAGILDGVTRRRVIALAHDAGIPLDEVAPWPADLTAADEVFLASSLRGIAAVGRVDGLLVGDGQPGPVTRRLAHDYAAARLSRSRPSKVTRR